MKVNGIAGMKKRLEKRLVEVGKVRDKIRNDISEFDELADCCDKAFDSIETAIDALSELA